MKMKLQIGQIMINRLSNGSKVVVRVLGLNVAGTSMVRVTDARESRPDAWLIEHNRTWVSFE